MPSRRRHARATSDLRLAIDCLPEHTRQAMLEGVRSNDIIVGAYVDGRGGVCPMLAAHRCGGRTDLLAFARAWDRFTETRRPRRATPREIGVLVAHLQASLLGEISGDLGDAIADHARLLADGRPRPEKVTHRFGDRHRDGELRQRIGWAWLRPFRRLDEYQRALARLDHQDPQMLCDAGASAEAPAAGRPRQLA